MLSYSSLTPVQEPVLGRKPSSCALAWRLGVVVIAGTIDSAAGPAHIGVCQAIVTRP
jgi:hypothetical protein